MKSIGYIYMLGMMLMCVVGIQAQPPYEGENESSEANIYGLSIEDRIRYVELCPSLSPQLANQMALNVRTLELLQHMVQKVKCHYKAVQEKAAQVNNEETK